MAVGFGGKHVCTGLQFSLGYQLLNYLLRQL